MMNFYIISIANSRVLNLLTRDIYKISLMQIQLFFDSDGKAV